MQNKTRETSNSYREQSIHSLSHTMSIIRCVPNRILKRRTASPETLLTRKPPYISESSRNFKRSLTFLSSQCIYCNHLISCTNENKTRPLLILESIRRVSGRPNDDVFVVHRTHKNRIRRRRDQKLYVVLRMIKLSIERRRV